MSFRQLTHHPTLFRSIRAACDGGRAASAREPEGESAQEPEREAAAEEAAAEEEGLADAPSRRPTTWSSRPSRSAGM